MGVEPTYAAWEAAVLPMNYTRVYSYFSAKSAICQELDKVNQKIQNG